MEMSQRHFALVCLPSRRVELNNGEILGVSEIDCELPPQPVKSKGEGHLPSLGN